MNALTRYRLRARLTAPELAGESGVSYPTIRRIEAGSVPSDDTLFALADALRVDPDVLRQELDADPDPSLPEAA